MILIRITYLFKIILRNILLTTFGWIIRIYNYLLQFYTKISTRTINDYIKKVKFFKFLIHSIENILALYS